MTIDSQSKQFLNSTSQLIFNPDAGAESVFSLTQLDREHVENFLALVNDHHVTVRTLGKLTRSLGGVVTWSERAGQVMAAEEGRIGASLGFLAAICNELEAAECPVVVFKTLDHWPDFGNDLDLFVTGDEPTTLQVLRHKFDAQDQVRSWGDYLAHKWSFRVPGCPADVELHINRLGQAGEHVEVARRFVARRCYFETNGHRFPVPAPEERVIAATLQRMYRHLYFRLCDIVNLTSLIRSGELSYEELAISADMGNIWPGVAGCLQIVCDYANQYLAEPICLPESIRAEKRWSANQLHLQGGFLHLSFVSGGAPLFCRQFANTLAAGDFDATMRLSLLPPLASVASLAYAVTGSNGRIW
jgi:hypothetical protein